ncbi:uncharacterized protein LOC106169527 [Lingula anatina]|uniref:Uncharacterized protein LOC106169527 n=1 Tax=Lingula anatina TaxID=7574 RepID=A0A1S3J1Z1_LINAN|nr:uncharacterized protein LOC106169527 [Lingula anatina]|eukprot:XP_013404452.1 uncharacterized protein LOC106169527 [Lingula anatina]
MIMMKLKIVDNIVAFYNEKMQTLYEAASKKKGKESPLEEFSDEDKKRDTLMELHRQAVDKALKEMYRRMAGFGCLEERDRTEYIATVPKMLDKLVKLEDETLMSKDRDGKPVRHSGPLLVGGELLKFRKQNLESSQRFCEKIAEKLFKEVRDDAMKYLYDYSMEKLCKKLDGARKDYISKARGPAKYEVLRNKLQSAEMEEFIDKLKAMKLFREAVIRGHIEQEDEHLKNEQSRQKVHEIAEHMDRIKWEKERVVELTGKYYNKLTQMIKEGPDIREQRDRNKTKQFMKAGMLKQARDLEEIMKKEAAATNPSEQCQWLSKEAEEARKIEQKLITIQKEKISMLKNGAIPKRKDCVIM